MAYNPRYTYGGKLRHSREFIGKGGLPNKNHRYVDKIPLGGNRYRYIYPEDIEAAKAAETRKQGMNAASAQKFANSQIGKKVSPQAIEDQRAARRAELTRNIQNAAAADREQARKDAGIQGMLRRASYGPRGLARKAANALGGVAGKVGSAFASATGGIRNTMKKTGETVGNWLNEQRRRIGEAWDGKAGRGTGYDQMQEYGKSGRGREAQAAKERYERSIVGRMNKARTDVGNWLGDRRRDVESAVGNARQRIGEAWDGKAGAGNGRDEADRLNAQADLDRRIADANAKAGRTDRYHEKATSSRANRAEAQRSQDAYDRSIVGRAEQLVNNIRGTANKAGEAVGTAARDVRSNARLAGQSISEQASKLIDKASVKIVNTLEPVTGSQARKNADKAGQLITQYDAIIRDAKKTGDQAAVKRYTEAKKKAQKAQQYYNNRANSSFVSKASSAISNAPSNVGNAASEFMTNVIQYPERQRKKKKAKSVAKRVLSKDTR